MWVWFVLISSKWNQAEFPCMTSHSIQSPGEGRGIEGGGGVVLGWGGSNRSNRGEVVYRKRVI